MRPSGFGPAFAFAACISPFATHGMAPSAWAKGDWIWTRQVAFCPEAGTLTRLPMNTLHTLLALSQKNEPDKRGLTRLYMNPKKDLARLLRGWEMLIL